MAVKGKNDEVRLSGEELDRIERVADMAERVSRRAGKGGKEQREAREDTAYGAALDPIMRQGFRAREARELGKAVGDAMKDSPKRKRAPIYD